MNDPAERLAALRTLLREEGLTHYLVPSSDEHLSEYPPAWRLRRPWLSGFTGSAGDVLVGIEDAWLFVDGRYHVQAAAELAGSGISLSRVGAPGQLTLFEHLHQVAKDTEGAVVGYEPWIVSSAFALALREVVEGGGGDLRSVKSELVDRIWQDRPVAVRTPLVPVATEWAGRPTGEKLAELRASLQELGADATVLVKLDQIAWLTNCRSADDVAFNPVFEGYAWVDAEQLVVFVHGGSERLPEGLDLPGVRFEDYEGFRSFLQARSEGGSVLLDPTGITRGVEALLEQRDQQILLAPSPVEAAKARKNEQERDGMRRANRQASAAKTRSLWWVKDTCAKGETVTERRFLEHIESTYRQMKDYWGLSFRTISAAGAHSALPHYGNADDTPLKSGELFLIDSGTQNAGGTTDDTRTIVIGQPSAEQRRIYTLVLKCHIASAAQVFPAGTPGSALDALTRAPLWAAGLDYDHGTGHGVGCFLNVHEGPFALSDQKRKPFAATPLEEGMITSIEPGYYREGWGGIRIENLYLIVEDHVDESGRQWLRFDSLTFIPLEDELIDVDLLDAQERAWLEAYRSRTKQELTSELTQEELARL
ncbi:MAG: aminopeptidase P family protein [Planctomycetota bacterium]